MVKSLVLLKSSDSAEVYELVHARQRLQGSRNIGLIWCYREEDVVRSRSYNEEAECVRPCIIRGEMGGTHGKSPEMGGKGPIVLYHWAFQKDVYQTIEV